VDASGGGGYNGRKGGLKMNKLKLVEYNFNHVVYQYIPEDKGDPGEVMFDFSTGKAAVTKRASNDAVGKYGHNATRRVSEYVEKRNFPIDATQAWY
jgi:hypothetical protein